MVALEFKDGITATFTLSGYTSFNGRQTRVHGTEGDLFFDEASHTITVNRFDNRESEKISLPVTEDYHPEDKEIVGNWLEAILKNDPSRINVNTHEALKTHAIVFAAERSRLEKGIVEAQFGIDK